MLTKGCKNCMLILIILYIVEEIMEDQIEYNNVSKILIKKFPDIFEDALWLDDDEILEYLVAGDFAKYIIKNINENNIKN
jgi:hypothetical protein